MDDLDRLMDKVLGRDTAEICRQQLPWLERAEPGIKLVQVGWLRPGETHVHTICVEQEMCEAVYVLRAHIDGTKT